jgi:PAS domain S-box-containing protein
MTMTTGRVLIVDDDPTTIEVLADALADEYEVIFATSGAQAVKLLDANLPDVVLLDIMMPEMDGYELCRRLKQSPHTAAIPVIFLTGMDQEEDEAKGLSLGAIDYLTKPLRPAIMRTRVRNQIELKRLRDRQFRAESSGRHEAEEQVRKLSRAIEQSPNAVILTDLKRVIEYVNPQFTAMTGYAAAEVIGKTPGMLAARAGSAAVLDALWATLARGQEWRGELADVDKDGRRFWVETIISPIRDAAQVVTHYVAMVQDITARKEAEVATARAIRAKTELMANMSHELRTPLNAIIGFAELMSSELFGPLGGDRYRDYAGTIGTSATHLLAVINDILDIAAAEAGGVDLQEEWLSVPALARRCVQLVGPLAQRDQLNLSIELPADLPELFADAGRVRQVLLNLLSNAVKFTPLGGSVTVEGGVRGDGSLALSVVDTGIGMDRAGVVTALSTFGQIDSGLSRRYEGSGLGLPLAANLVQLHGGELVIDSEPGKGTRVTVTFPAARMGAV